MIDILIGGDLCPINSNERAFTGGEVKEVFDIYERYFLESDLSIVNLEAPLTCVEQKGLKAGANIKASPSCITGIKKAGIKLLSAANNHIGDYGKEGIQDTIEICRRNNVPVIGIGNDIKEANEPYVFEKDNIKVGVLSFADTEFGMASNVKPGANPLDIIESSITIRSLKKKVNYLVVLIHDGKEYYSYPSPELQKICRFLIGEGADLIVCQHSHVIGAWERYMDGNIIYGQGNLIFDYAKRKSRDWVFGNLVRIKINDTSTQIESIPYKQTFPGIKPLNDVEEEWYVNHTSVLNKNVYDNNFITTNWENYCRKLENNYLNLLKGNGNITRNIIGKMRLKRCLYSKKKIITLLNITRSRAHKEALVTVLNRIIEKN